VQSTISLSGISTCYLRRAKSRRELTSRNPSVQVH
jgi:hypothetical protein